MYNTLTPHLCMIVKVSYEKYLTLPSSYLTDNYDGDEESEEEIEEGTYTRIQWNL